MEWHWDSQFGKKSRQYQIQFSDSIMVTGITQAIKLCQRQRSSGSALQALISFIGLLVNIHKHIHHMSFIVISVLGPVPMPCLSALYDLFAKRKLTVWDGENCISIDSVSQLYNTSGQSFWMMADQQALMIESLAQIAMRVKDRISKNEKLDVNELDELLAIMARSAEFSILHMSIRDGIEISYVVLSNKGDDAEWINATARDIISNETSVFSVAQVVARFSDTCFIAIFSEMPSAIELWIDEFYSTDCAIGFAVESIVSCAERGNDNILEQYSKWLAHECIESSQVTISDSCESFSACISMPLSRRAARELPCVHSAYTGGQVMGFLRHELSDRVALAVYRRIRADRGYLVRGIYECSTILWRERTEFNHEIEIVYSERRDFMHKMIHGSTVRIWL